ncbi:ATP-dependent helicase [[Clostridium] colinum]|uniref:ATP-dependent helicase n=1 Tax=[Clostridium] colinum TaxID=36835 RepID=UPI0020241C69|nr:UvrD-helicase domain-containing protein [[Clostridium] colinum]
MEELLNKLNPMQKEAVLTTEGALLLLAGAGSGKTRVLTHRIAYLIEKGIRPFNILAITFTNKAAKEMRERVSSICQEGNQVLVSTFHSLCVRILRVEIEKLGYTNKFTIYDADDAERLIKEIMKEYKINDEKLSPKTVLNTIGRQKDKLITATIYSQNVGSDFRKKNISDIYLEYEKLLKINNALDFDDLIFKTVQLFANHIDVLEKYQERFKYIMVDEYQDTSTSQYTLIKMLSNKYKNICVVGDDDQSIYGWRGADINNILDFEKDFKDTKVIKLEQNYRSTKTILDAANYVIKNNFGRKEKRLWTENEQGGLISYEKCDSDRKEAVFVANEILNKIKEGYSYKDFAILYRANNLSRVIEEQLVFLSIPYKLYGGINFYGRREIKDIISYLKILENPSDEISLKRIINVPKRGIGDTSVSKISEYANKNNITFFEALSKADEITELGRKTKTIIDFYNLILDFIEKSEEVAVTNLIKYILDKTGYIEELEKEGTDEAQGRISNLEEFINKAVEYENNEDEEKSLTRFLEEISLVADIDSMEDEEDVVTLMTLHSSKGLEFPIVFIVGFEDGIFPSYRALMSEDASAVEEERRLLYVGITRAKNKLYITNAKSRLKQGRYEGSITSSFFKELPKNLIHIKEKVEKTPTISFNTEENNGKYRPKPTYKPNPLAYLKKEMPTPKNISLDFEIGDKVRHFKFGQGTVLKIDPAGADYEVTINFDNFGEKKLMANLSKLKKA